MQHYMRWTRDTSCGYKGPFGPSPDGQWYSWYPGSTDCLDCLRTDWPHSTRLKELLAGDTAKASPEGK